SEWRRDVRSPCEACYAPANEQRFAGALRSGTCSLGSVAMSGTHQDGDRNARRALRRRWVRFLGVFAMCLPATQCLRNDEVDCEEAVQHMIQCCPGFNPNAIQCEYYNGCDLSYPDLTTRESSCILDTSCTGLRNNGICARVQSRSMD